MNPFDVLILAVVLLSVMYALYRGAVHSVLSQAALLISLLVALPLSAGPAEQLQGNTGFTSLLVTYTDAVARVGDYDYVRGAVVSSAIRILCFLCCFCLCYFALSLLLSLLNHVFQFPLLKYLDWAGAALFGVLRGLTLVCAIWLLMPLLSTVIPVDGFRQALDGSALSRPFLSQTFFHAVLNGRLF